MKQKKYELLTKLFMDELIPYNKKRLMPSFSQAVNIKNFYINIRKNLPKKIFYEYLNTLDNFEKNKKIDFLSKNLPNLLSNIILIEYYCSKKVSKRLKFISQKIT